MCYHYKIIKGISLHSRVKLIIPPRRNHVISKWHKLLIINSSSKSYCLWPIQWCNLKFQRIIPYYKGISLNFNVMYLRVSTLQTVFCAVFGVSILSYMYARLTSAGAITRGPKGLISCTWVQCATFLRNQPGDLVFPIGPKNTNLVEDVEILLPGKFRWILFSGFRGEVENVSANQRPGRPSCFSDRPEKHKLGRRHWDLASCQVSLNSVQRFQRRSWKCLSQSEARAAILFFRLAQKTQTR